MVPDSGPVATSAGASICIDCGAAFAPSSDELAARRGRGLPPSERCPACRERRRDERNARRVEGYRTGAIGSRVADAPGPDGGAVRLYPARCADCGREIRVPFAPQADRPVYCQGCLNLRNGR